jgi:twitching motility two-component system response regulator PilH
VPLKILVVDDEYEFAEFAKLLIDGMGHQTTTSLEAEAALRVATDLKPDVIITDMTMPEMDGLEFVRRLKADPATRAIPVIICSNSTSRTHLIEAMKQGALYSILKPMQREPLKILLDQIQKLNPPA